MVSAAYDCIEALATTTLADFYNIARRGGADPLTLIGQILVTRKVSPVLYESVFIGLSEQANQEVA